jgi:1-acyl-sn-glycerol-3-phosphate acyltransferase
MNESAEFRPPARNPAFVALCQFLLPAYAKLNKLHFYFHESNSKPSTQLKPKRTLILLNHADRHDPAVVVALTRYLRQSIFIVVAREVFDWSNGMLGWVMQKFGGYSVNRGLADFPSISMTKAILMKKANKLVVFPEAEITGDDDSVHDISATLAHVVLEAQEELSAAEPDESIFFMPVGVSYQLVDRVSSTLDKALTRVEEALNQSNNVQLERANHDLADRLKLAVDVVLAELARRNSCTIPSRKSQAEEVEQLARSICESIALRISAKLNPAHTSEQAMYSLRNDVIALNSASQAAQASEASPADAALLQKELLRELDSVERLLILHRILLLPPSAMHSCRIVDFLEAEVFGKMTVKGHQKISIYLGDLIPVASYLPHYLEHKHEAIRQLNKAIHDELQAALDHSHLHSSSPSSSRSS